MDNKMEPLSNEMRSLESTKEISEKTLTKNIVSVGKSTVTTTTISTPSKILKRCLSVPIIPPVTSGLKFSPIVPSDVSNDKQKNGQTNQKTVPSITSDALMSNKSTNCGISVSNGFLREVPSPSIILTTRARRYSASYSPVCITSSSTLNVNNSLCVTPRVSQLRQEECIDVNSREINHEREIHCAMQISQSWEDLTLVAENWSCKSEEGNNSLHVVLPSTVNSSSSSSSPISNRGIKRLPYGLSPSPTRRTFATRRSMSPIAMRPSQLGSVKRKFELDDTNSSNSWNFYSQPPPKKILVESRDSSPVGQPSPLCASPDSGTYDGRITPKLLVSKLCTNNIANLTSVSPSPGGSSSSSVINEQISNGNNNDEGIVVSDNDADKVRLQRVSVDVQDESIMMDDTKSETSSIGGCSNISVESSSCDSAIKNLFVNILSDESYSSVFGSKCVPQKHFYINKQGVSGAKKFIVNHENFSTVPRGSDDQIDTPVLSTTKQNKID